MTNGKGTPALSKMAIVTPHIETTAPIDRSIPAVRITIVCPIASMISTLATVNTFNRFVGVKKTGESSAMIKQRSAKTMRREPLYRKRKSSLAPDDLVTAMLLIEPTSFA